MKVGIDVSKNKHFVCILDKTNTEIYRTKISNTKLGVEHLKSVINRHTKELQEDVVIGVESTGVYWYPIYNELSKNYDVRVYNPKQIRAFGKTQIRATQTDRIDAKTIAEAMSYKPGNKVNKDYIKMNIRELCRYRFKLIDIRTNLKKRLRRTVYIIFPLYDTVFKGDSFFGSTSMAILKTCPTPEQISRLGEEKLLHKLRKKHKNIQKKKIKEIVNAAERTITADVSKEACVFEIRNLISQINALNKDIAKIEKKILLLWDKVDSVYKKVKEIPVFLAATMYGETGAVSNYPTKHKLVATAGLDVKMKQSGNKIITGRITKRGSKTLRRAVYISAECCARHHPEIREYFKKKRSEGLHYRKVICACGKKLLRYIWGLEHNRKLTPSA